MKKFFYEKQLFYKKFDYPIAYTGEYQCDYIRVMMYFDFKEGLRFSVNTANFGHCSRNIFKAFTMTLEIATVGYDKYQTLKDDCRDKGFWKELH